MADARDDNTPHVKERGILFSAPERFWRLVDKETGPLHPTRGTRCWLWIGRLSSKGYGRFGRGTPAHQEAIRLVGRDIPCGMELDHTCRVRRCVNPDHLDVVTHAENLRRKPVPETCPAGHGRFTRGRDGKRVCMDCGVLRNSARYRLLNPTVVRRSRKHLTDQERSAIRALISEGLSHAEIAPRFDISIGTVSRVRNANA